MIIVITGTSRGIGLSLAKHYTGSGPAVIGCSRGESELVHHGYEHYVVDLSNEEEINAFTAAVRKKYGRVVSVLSDFRPSSIALFLALIELDMIIVPISKAVKDTENYLKISESEYFIDAINEIKIKQTGRRTEHSLPGQVVAAQVKVCDENNNRDFIKKMRKFCSGKLETYKIPIKYNLTTSDLYGERFKEKR